MRLLAGCDMMSSYEYDSTAHIVARKCELCAKDLSKTAHPEVKRHIICHFLAQPPEKRLPKIRAMTHHWDGRPIRWQKD